MTNREKVLTASFMDRHFETDREKFIAAINSPEFRYTMPETQVAQMALGQPQTIYGLLPTE